MPSYLGHYVDAVGMVADMLIDPLEHLRLFRVDRTAPGTANPPALLTVTTTFWLSTVARRFTTAGAVSAQMFGLRVGLVIPVRSGRVLFGGVLGGSALTGRNQ